MRPIIIAFVCAFLLGTQALFDPPPTEAGWGHCGAPVGADAYTDGRAHELVKTVDAGGGCEWRTYRDAPGQVMLFKGGVQIAGYRPDTNEYRAYNAATQAWSEPTAPPWEQCVDTCECDCCRDRCDCGNGSVCSGACGCVAAVGQAGVIAESIQAPKPIGAIAEPSEAMDVPVENREWLRNEDGSCVQCSIALCGLDQNVPEASTLLWDTEYGPKVRGGSYPSRVTQYCDARGIRAYNVTGDNTWDWMRWACLTGRGAAIGAGNCHFQTLYGYDPATKTWFVENNNSPRKIDRYDDEHFRRLHLASGQWVVVLAYPPHPERPEYVPWWENEEPKKIGGYRQTIAPEVERDEVIRRGDYVEIVGFGPRALEDELFAQAVAPPADDSAKWFVYVITMQGCPACDKLKSDWNKSPDLLAFAKPDDPASSWAHFTIYDQADASQAFRFQKIKLTSFPTVIIQPPRTNAFGDPKTVVFQKSGYDGDPRKLAAEMSSAIKRYVATLPKREGVAQCVRPPFNPPPKPRPLPVAPDQPPAPFVVPGPNIPPEPAPKPDAKDGSTNGAVAAVSILIAGAMVLALLSRRV